MTLMVYNTLTRKKEAFVPIEEGKVKMYVCGPTVYNYIHIGNARPAIVFDTVRRYFEYRGYDVNYVSNFTDVDDRLIHASKERHQPVPEIADRFIKAFLADVGALNVKKATINPRATETMPEIIAFIGRLVDMGFAYPVNGDVYYRTRKFKDYGKLSHQSVDDLKSGARIEIGENKEDPLDFALWKAAKPGEIKWSSPWGDGRPGWHIECSAMVDKYLGETIDIHAGGTDLIFPHHENEIAQSEALHHCAMAHYWLHNGHIQINNEKMSKSIGNVILVHDLIKKYDPLVVRFFILTVQYRHPINFSDELLNDAVQAFGRLQTVYYNLDHRLKDFSGKADADERMEHYRDRFIEAMDDDFNTANAISVLFDLAKDANIALQRTDTDMGLLFSYRRVLFELSNVLGLKLEGETESMLDSDVEAMIERRETARQQRQFALADDIRNQLKNAGVVLEDTPQGVRWKRGQE
ncbi:MULTISPECIES: cysteine--tRNA ligase [unclassified Sporolactobacillus]|uniref:cysteine--tRNA ligase n=1 Tax=unclassified Sporolactobacillus TaxID=2628533 RepID=UPI00236813A7|nr:cysteine--tRNA ligase [Sporolactobacillus sp. CQH2019]MDD9150499.1 cysteine--tRNA ligase [Sporolactobacillus sp. CQH2019]